MSYIKLLQSQYCMDCWSWLLNSRLAYATYFPAIFVYLAIHYISLQTFRSELHRQVNHVREGKKKNWKKKFK